MKRSPLYLILPVLVAAMVLALMSTQQTASAKESKELHEAMETLGGTYRDVRRQMKDASKNADTADKLAKMINASLTAKAHLPTTASTDDLKLKYRVIMNKLIITLSQAENAALEGDQDKLIEYVTAANSVKGEGHEMFIADDE